MEIRGLEANHWHSKQKGCRQVIKNLLLSLDKEPFSWGCGVCMVTRSCWGNDKNHDAIKRKYKRKYKPFSFAQSK